MTTWVALLRGVNVGGRNRLPMAELRRALTGAGFGSVSTLIQSGNILLEPGTAIGVDTGSGPASPQADGIARAVAEVIAVAFGLDIAVVVLAPGRLQAVLAANPFPEMAEQPRKLFVAFTQDPVSASALDDFDVERFRPDRVAVADGVLYTAYPQGMARSKLTTAVLDRVAGAPTTARNWNTVSKLAELQEAESPG